MFSFIHVLFTTAMASTNIATALAEKLADVEVTLVFYYLSLAFLSIIVTIPFRGGNFIFKNVTWLSLTFLDGAILWSWGEREPRGSSMKQPLITLGVFVLLAWFLFSVIVLIQTAEASAGDSRQSPRKQKIAESEKRKTEATAETQQGPQVKTAE
ncbi:hypothetical protein EDB81DRAFT_791991 [Dactylonectria macrodidyma]|uniref:MARVEL domain-containing protein n=1 Tax=Dactylonectria macrodidyma TaxID=307937 RepID=A0A9P9EUV9_9HYPO|nr:hypothetical protein EDB81DRAFT_791991 [Dactylonectria macrodidyma]